MGAMSSDGALRISLAALWTNGGFEVKLRWPGLAASGSDAEQLGLGTPDFQDLPLGPCVWRRLGAVSELLLGAQAISELMGSQATASAESLFQGAVGVVVGEELYLITGCRPLLLAGTPIAYRLRVEAPVWN